MRDSCELQDVSSAPDLGVLELLLDVRHMRAAVDASERAHGELRSHGGRARDRTGDAHQLADATRLQVANRAADREIIKSRAEGAECAGFVDRHDPGTYCMKKAWVATAKGVAAVGSDARAAAFASSGPYELRCA